MIIDSQYIIDHSLVQSAVNLATSDPTLTDKILTQIEKQLRTIICPELWIKHNQRWACNCSGDGFCSWSCWSCTCWSSDTSTEYPDDLQCLILWLFEKLHGQYTVTGISGSNCNTCYDENVKSIQIWDIKKEFRDRKERYQFMWIYLDDSRLNVIKKYNCNNFYKMWYFDL